MVEVFGESNRADTLAPVGLGAKPGVYLTGGFAWALNRVMNGRLVHRPGWPEANHVRFVPGMGGFQGEFLMLFREDDRLYHPWLVSREDVEALDWTVAGDMSTCASRSVQDTLDASPRTRE